MRYDILPIIKLPYFQDQIKSYLEKINLNYILKIELLFEISNLYW